MSGKRVTGRMVLFGLLGGFGVVCAVNGAMIWFAIDTWPGLINANPYQEGLAYNEVLQARAAQAELGWTIEARAEGRTVEVAVSDEALRPVTGLSISGVAHRPASEDADQTMEFYELAPGIYRSTGNLQLPGTWSIVAEAYDADAASFHFERRIFVTP